MNSRSAHSPKLYIVFLVSHKYALFIQILSSRYTCNHSLRHSVLIQNSSLTNCFLANALNVILTHSSSFLSLIILNFSLTAFLRTTRLLPPLKLCFTVTACHVGSSSYCVLYLGTIYGFHMIYSCYVLFASVQLSKALLQNDLLYITHRVLQKKNLLLLLYHSAEVKNIQNDEDD